MRRGGFSLLEVVVAFAVFLTLSVFMFNLVPSSVLAIRQGELRLEAGNLARTLLESHRAKGFTALQPDVGKVIYAEEHQSVTGVVYKSEVKVRTVPSAEQTRLLDLSVTVGWQYHDTQYKVSTGAYVWNAQQQ